MHKKSILIIDNFLVKSRKSAIQSEKLSELLTTCGWQARNISYKNNRFFRLMDVCLKCLRPSDYSVVLINMYSGLYFWLAYIAALILRVSNKPYVLMLRGGNLPDFTKRHVGRVTMLLNSAIAVAAPSDYLRQKMEPYFGRDIMVIPNGIEIGKYPFRLRKAVQPKLIWLRSFHKIYNPCLAIEALGLLRADFPDMRLQMVGADKDGSYRQAKKAAKYLGLSECVESNPGIGKENVPERLNSGDIFINTANIDNTPVSVIEAMACGLCIVSTNVGGIPYLLEDSADALLVPPGDAQAMADAIRSILNSPELAERLSRSGRQKAERLDWSLVFKKWTSLLSEVVPKEPSFYE